MKKVIHLFLISLLALCFNSVQAQIKVACVGNSITYGSGIQNRELFSYPVQLQNLLGDEYKVENFGKPGATLLKKGHNPYQNCVEFAAALDFEPDIVVIHLGINDTDPRNWPNYKEEFVGDYLDLINKFKKVNPNCRVILAEMTPISHRHGRFESGTRDWHSQIQVAIRTVAKVVQCELIDFFSPLYAYPHHLPDAIHPDAEGAGKLAKVVYSAISGDYGGLSLADIFGDGMVLPHGKSFTLTGKANAGEVVSLKIAEKSYQTKANNRGDWTVELAPLKAGGPYVLTVKSSSKSLTFNNVLAGEIWLCSGQSNMEFKLMQTSSAKEDISNANNTNIRLYNMDAKWRTDAVEWPVEALDRINDLDYFKPTQWTELSNETGAQFSAIGYHFGRVLQDSLQIPIGLICNAVGGSTQESWVSRSELEFNFPRVLYSWTTNDFIQAWARGRALQNIAKSTNKLQRHPYEPAYLFEAGIEPIRSFPISGVIWYQGESNAHNVEAYEKLFKLFVNSVREAWQSASLPLFYVQLSSLNRGSWPTFRDAQRRLANEIDNVAMVVSSDRGDINDVHPTDKKPIGERLAFLALNRVYGYKSLTSTGPDPVSAELIDREVVLTFENGEGLQGRKQEEITTFELAELDGCYYPATQVKIVGNTIRLKSKEVTKPQFVRYGWQPFTEANLINKAKLPASTFKLSIPYKK